MAPRVEWMQNRRPRTKTMTRQAASGGAVLAAGEVDRTSWPCWLSRFDARQRWVVANSVPVMGKS